MEEKRKTKVSKFLSLILRHKPEEVGLTLDESGWARVSDLLKACADYGQPFTQKDLQEIVNTNDKKRFSFDETETKIRANQGHSIKLKINFEKRMPPKILYHGTAEKNLGKIFADGLKKMNRHHVHLSADKETAQTVGMRYGKPIVFEIETDEMIREGFEFFISANGVWLIDAVPPKFLKVL